MGNQITHEPRSKAILEAQIRYCDKQIADAEQEIWIIYNRWLSYRRTKREMVAVMQNEARQLHFWNSIQADFHEQREALLAELRARR